MKALLHRWLTALFAIDLRTLALFRAALGTILAADLLMRLADLRAFYTDLGILPRDWVIATNGPWRLSLHLINGDSWFAALLFAVHILAALGFAIGWRTRRMTVVLFVLQASLLNRDQLVLLGGDLLINCLLFWSLFLPLGARFSIDAALSQKPLADNRHLSPAAAGLLLQVLSVYFFSALLKTGREWWPEGTAVDYALQIDAFVTPIGGWLRGFPALTHALTYYVWWLELLAPLVALLPVFTRPLRFVVMVLLMTMHVGFLLCLKLGPFPFFSIASLTVLTGSWVWDVLDRHLQRREAAAGPEPLRIFYDRDCGFCLKSVLILKRLLILPRAQIAPAQDHARADALMAANYSWVIIDHDDRAHLKWPAFVVLLRRSPLLAWLGWLLAPGTLRGGWAVRPGNTVYDFVGRHRDGFGRASAALLPFHERPFEVSAGWPAAAGAFLLLGTLVALLAFNLSALGATLTGAVLVIGAGLLIVWLMRRRPGTLPVLLAIAAPVLLLCWNLCTVGALPARLYNAMGPPLRVLRIDQIWDMFAPFPAKEDGWYVIPATRADGREIDLRHPEREAVSYDKPRYVADEFPNIRWHKFLERVYAPGFSNIRPNYARWLCRQWNLDHPAGEQIKTLRIVYMLETSVPYGQTPTLEQRPLWKQDCVSGSGSPQ